MRLGLLPPGLSGSGGPGTYVTGVARGLVETSSELEVRALILGSKQLLPRARRERARAADMLGPSGRITVRGRPLSSRLYRSPASAVLPSYDHLFGRHDLYHQMHLDLDPPVPGNRLVVTLHDLVAEHWPDEGRLIPGAGSLLARAAAVITVSAASKTDILSRFASVSPERVHVVWNGVDHVAFAPRAGHADNEDDTGRLRALGLERPFLLYIGGLTRRKNVSVLLRAHELFRAGRSDAPALVLVGPWDSAQLADRRIPGAVLPMGALPRESLAALMRRSTAVVLPSRHEGFGLPILEAQSCGALVACSDIPPFREVGGLAPLYLDSTAPESLAAALESVLDLPSAERDRRISAGIEHAARFSWQRSAQEHLRVYEQVLADSAG